MNIVEDYRLRKFPKMLLISLKKGCARKIHKHIMEWNKKLKSILPEIIKSFYMLGDSTDYLIIK